VSRIDHSPFTDSVKPASPSRCARSQLTAHSAVDSPLGHDPVPRLQRTLGIEGPQHRAQRVPGVVGVHVVGHVDTVHHQSLDEAVDVDIGELRVEHLHPGEVGVAEQRPPQVDPPEHRIAQVLTLELARLVLRFITHSAIVADHHPGHEGPSARRPPVTPGDVPRRGSRS
jgi:hypothetical protein